MLYQENCRIDTSYHVPGVTFALVEGGNGDVAFQGKDSVGKPLEWPLSGNLLTEEDLVVRSTEVANRSNGAKVSRVAAKPRRFLLARASSACSAHTTRYKYIRTSSARKGLKDCH